MSISISIRDHGPLKAKVSITIDGLSIVFPETSYSKLCELLKSMGAQQGEGQIFDDAIRESHWTLDIDPVRDQAFQSHLDHATDANSRLSDELKAAQSDIGLLKEVIKMQATMIVVQGLVIERYELMIKKASLWKRLWRVFRNA